MKMHSLSSGLAGRFLCLLLSVAMATGPSAAVFAQTNAAAQAVRQRVQGLEGGGESQPAPTTPPPGDDRDYGGGRESMPAIPGAGSADTSYVAPNAVAIIVLRPAQLLAAPLAQMFPVEVASAAGLKNLGFDPADIEQAVAFAQMPSGESPQVDYGVAIKFLKPFKGAAIPAHLRAHAAPGDLAGRKYLQSRQPMLPSLYAPDAKTLVAAPDTTLRQLVESKDQPKSGSVIDRVHAAPPGSDLYVAVDVAALRPLMAVGLMQAAQQLPPGTPPEVQQFFEAPNLISAAELTFNVSASGPMSLVVHANDDASAERLEQLVDAGMQLYQSQLKAQMAAQATGDDPIAQAMARYMERMSVQWADSFRPQREGAKLTFFKTEGDDPAKQQLTQVAVIGILVALLLPAIQAAREAARRTDSSYKMKQIMLALHNFHDTRKNLPAHAIYNADGQPLLSWRVQILPYLEDGGAELYKEFKLDEPWDSEHNRPLIARMPAVFSNPNFISEPGKTNFLGVVGEHCGFNGTKQGLGFKHFTDGTSKTIVLVEADADRAVEWTKPDDWQYDASNPSAGLGKLRPGVFNAGFADGSVQQISNNIDPEMLKAHFTRDGGEVIPQTLPPQIRNR